MSGLHGFLDRLLGRGGSAVTVPTLDGPLLPNQALEEGTAMLRLPGLDNLTVRGPEVLFSLGPELRALDPAEGSAGRLVRTVSGPITAIAAGPAGTLALAVEGSGLMLIYDGGERIVAKLGDTPASCITALAWLSATALAVAVGAAGRGVTDWRRDLMEGGRTGSVWRVESGTGEVRCLARELAWPGGLALTPGDRLIVSEAWRHRLLEIDARKAGTSVVLLADLPAYPGRISAAEGGGYWLACPTIRNQLVEFILREPGYRTRMLAEVPEPYWMAPTLASGLSFKEPMQGSQLKQMGILKPWAATRSYGLVIRCDDRMQPLFSYHSRADGHVHGVTSVCEWRGSLLVGAKGAGEIVNLRVLDDARVKVAAE